MTADPAGPNPRRSVTASWRATGVMLLVLLVGVGILWFIERAQERISLDVLELLPRDEQDPTIRLARQTVSGRFGRTVLIAVSDRDHAEKAPVEAAAKMAAGLRADPAFAGAFAGLTDESKDQLGKWFFDRRLPLRLPIWLDAMRARWQKEKDTAVAAKVGEPDATWLASAVVSDLQEFQSTPDALAAQELLPRDPLLLIPGLLNVFSADDKSTASEVSGGALSAVGPSGRHYALIYAECKGSPLEAAGQKPVFDALTREFEAARKRFGSGLEMYDTGVGRFAADSRSRIEGEISLLTNISLGLSALLMLYAFRRVSVFLYLVLPIVTATAWALVLCFAVFPRIHVVAIVFTTVLIGVALDYGIYTLSHAQRTAGGLGQALREIRRPLIGGCLTSVGGFVFMLFTNLPMLQQMGMAVALGLLFSLAAYFLYLPWMPALPVRAQHGAMPRFLTLGGPLFPILALSGLAVALGLMLLAHVQWNDNIRSLQTMSPKLEQEQNFLRQLFGQSKDEHIVITFGNDLNDAFANLDKLNGVLAAHTTAPNQRFFNLGRLLPTAAQTTTCREYFRIHPQFTEALRSALDKDFNTGAFAPFWETWDAWMHGVSAGEPGPTPAQQLDGLRDVLPLPLQNLWNEEQSGSAWLATRVNSALYEKLPASTLTAPNTPIDQVETLNNALRRYRVAATQRAGIGLGLIAVVVLAYYGLRRGGFILAVPAIGIMLTVGVLGLCGQTLGLLHVVGLLLGFCLSSDYSIFLASSGELPHSTHRAIWLASGTALLSFGVLSFSKIEALRDICLPVTMIIGTGLLLCEISYRLFVRNEPASQ